jgi:hypothetical protein
MHNVEREINFIDFSQHSGGGDGKKNVFGLAPRE